ncbi:MAG: methyltransferase domain-containing protein [Bacteroidota bacterium]
MEETLLPAEFWDDLYRREETRWDIGFVSTPIKEYIDQLTNKNLRILIPGAGSSYEAIYLAERGFTDITVADISPLLTKRLQETIEPLYPSIKIITGDFFLLNGQFDLVIEQTFFCALHPSLRKKYLQKVKELLTGNGKLAGLLFNREFDNNPPFGGGLEEYRQLFSSGLRIKLLEDCINSIPARKGTELFFIAENDKLIQ